MKLVWALLFMLGAVFIEIAGMIIVGSRIGVMATLALLALAMVAGFALLRHFGQGYIARAQHDLEQGKIPERAIVDGAIHFIACLLLIVPGFVTDIFALMLFVPPVRDLLWRVLSKRMVVRAYPEHWNKKKQQEKKAKTPPTIELEAQDYQARDPENSPWRRDDSERR